MDNNQIPNTQPVETPVAAPAAEPVAAPVQPAYNAQPTYATQPAYVAQPAGQVVKTNPALSIVALVCGIAALILFYVPVMGLLCGIAAIILAAIARKKARNGMNTAGLILGIIGTVLGAIFTIVMGAACAEATSYDYDDYYYDYYYSATNWDYLK